MKKEAQHLHFWDVAIDEVNSWQFLKRSSAPKNETVLVNCTPEILRPPSQDGWLATIRGVKHLWNILKRIGFKYLRTRSLNQDPLEHLFGSIRGNCGCNNNPTVSQFQAALKTSIINGIAFRELKSGNCELEDEPGELLSKLHDFLYAEPQLASDQEPSTGTQEHPTNYDFLVEEFEIDSYSVAYVSGYIARRLLKNITCDNCKACLTTETVESFHKEISLREYFANKCLSYPTEELCKAVGAGATVLENMMPEVAHLSGVRQCVAGAIKETVNFSWIGEKCVDHQVPIINGIVQGICAVSIPWWCRKKNLHHRCKKNRNNNKKKIFCHM